MSCLRRFARSIVVAGAGFVWCTTAHAQQEPLDVALDYWAPDACASPDAFWRALVDRTRRVNQAAMGEAEILLRVHLRQGTRGIVGRLQIVQKGFATEPRYVAASDCKQVLDALALTAALGIDPEALTRPPDEASERPDFIPLEPPRAYVPTIPWYWDMALEGGLVTAWPIDVRASWGIAAGFIWNARRPGAWEPAVRIGGAVLSSNALSSADNARFHVTTSNLQLCLARGGGPTLVFRPCVTGQAGVLIASGQNLTDPERSQRYWLAAGPALELEYQSNRHVTWQLELAALLPLNPQRYRAGADAQVVATTPAVTPWLGLSFGYMP